MVRLLLLLLIAAGLTIFTVQNLSPIAIVVLGIKTQTLPLAVWVLGAIIAGGLTTVLLSGFSSLSRSAAVRRSTRRAEPEPSRSSWSGGSQRQSESSRRNAAGFSATRQTADDWDTPSSDDWDDWGEDSAHRPASSSTSSSSSTSPSSNTRIRDTSDDEWKDWSGYEESRRPASGSTSGSTYQRTPRTDFEARRTPTSTQRAGSSYSYSYREPQDTPPERSSERRVDRPSDKTSEVYDAEYRVLVPPYNPDSAPPVSPPPPEPPLSTPPPSSTPTKAEDDEDWGDLFDDLDSNKR